jgi:hypothetical protein
MCVSTNPEIRGPVEIGGLSGAAASSASIASPDSEKVESDWGIGLYNPSDGRDIEVEVEGTCLLSTGFLAHRVH